jgi:hypothetical protein
MNDYAKGAVFSICSVPVKQIGPALIVVSHSGSLENHSGQSGRRLLLQRNVLRRGSEVAGLVAE